MFRSDIVQRCLASLCQAAYLGQQFEAVQFLGGMECSRQDVIPELEPASCYGLVMDGDEAMVELFSGFQVQRRLPPLRSCDSVNCANATDCEPRVMPSIWPKVPTREMPLPRM